MSAGAVVWARSDEFLVVGTVCLFLIPFAIIGFGTFNRNRRHRMFILHQFGAKVKHFLEYFECLGGYIYPLVHLIFYWSFCSCVRSDPYLLSNRLILGSADDDEQILVIFTLLAAVPIALFVTLEMFLTVQKTDQIQPEAWALVKFKTCDVTVRTTYGIYLVMYVIAGTATLRRRPTELNSFCHLTF
jgi:hypothetical protein